MVLSTYHPAHPLALALGCLVEKVRSLHCETVRKAYSAIFLSPSTAKQGRHIYTKCGWEKGEYIIYWNLCFQGTSFGPWLGHKLVNPPRQKIFFQICMTRHAISNSRGYSTHTIPQQCFPFLLGHAGSRRWWGWLVIIDIDAWDEGQRGWWHSCLPAEGGKKEQWQCYRNPNLLGLRRSHPHEDVHRQTPHHPHHQRLQQFFFGTSGAHVEDWLS